MAQRRLSALRGATAAAAYDVDPLRAEALGSRSSGIQICRSAETLLDASDIILISTPHNVLASCALAAVAAGRHVLLEKPGACAPSELDPVIATARRTGSRVRVGYNHRFHRAISKAHEIWRAGECGEPMFVRGRYGHGGRLGYEKEWRFNRALSGGGQLIDQGVHLIDLARWFLGDFVKASCALQSYFWQADVEDNAFLLLETADRQTAFLHAGWTEWKNLFSLEVVGRTGKLQIDGLGGSYGVEKLTFYRMLPEMGPPETAAWEWPMADNSFELEFSALLSDIALGREPSPGLQDARRVLEIVAAIQGAADK